MFTGLIQGRGTLRPLSGDRFAVVPVGTGDWADLAIGDSVAVDGACLTVEALLSPGFVASLSPETLGRTTLGLRSRSAEWVNVELSLRVGDKLGGHFVSGHVDGLGCLTEAIATERSWELTFGAAAGYESQWQQQIARYLVAKGSIAVNGISLTVADCDAKGRWFKVAVIPHTYEQTNLSTLQVGDWVNLESDLLGKYVDKLLSVSSLPPMPEQSVVSLTFLAEHGYI